MARRKKYFDKGEPVDAPDTKIEDEELAGGGVPDAPEPGEAPAKSTKGDVLLKPHVHAGTMYAAGTPLSELNPSDTLLEKLRNLGVV